MILSKSLYLSDLQLPHLHNGDHYRTYFPDLSWAQNELIFCNVFWKPSKLVQMSAVTASLPGDKGIDPGWLLRGSAFSQSLPYPSLTPGPDAEVSEMPPVSLFCTSPIGPHSSTTPLVGR